ncbi:MAG: phosphoribosyltransferase [Candidatus Acidulodesulfobacterium ferriphilum]|uniref:Phosphoribosyltransferase n=1 Tax=Candidatus Acidulodesulfobacterium ferriphilum TaxID=2597223 RepID=A0A519BAT7_9DELT|nr:MAG: phosphoribosyltransferase [Candidatus Acidulodesulfobacterium ferriphilum]
MIFKNRQEAGKLLGKNLLKHKYKPEKTVVIGLLRGGIPVAYEIAKALNAPLDVALVRKIGAPDQEELAIGAIVDGENPKVYLNKSLISRIAMPEGYIDRVKEIKLEEIRKREKIYRKGGGRIDVHGKIAIVVDDGIATGASIKVVIEALKEEKPEKIIIAVPVIPKDTLNELKKTVDDVIVLDAPEEFYAVGEFYEDFGQTTDEEVISLLQKSKSK